MGDDDKILIIIPMRAGSQDINRKNLRRVTQTESLASRVIMRAVDLAAALPSGADVVVMTDDAAAAGLALAHGVQAWNRDPAKAGGDATIQDAVLEYQDAHPAWDYDLTVVMQSTSPWLELHHCLEAIEEVTLRGSGSATVVAPAGKLSWNGHAEPLFERRVNRQLESDAIWAETGGIHVVRGFPRFDGRSQDEWMVSPQHSLVQVSGPAAIDIDSPQDMLLARQVWDAGRVLYVCLGDVGMWGGGHVHRARLIAEELELSHNVTVVCPDLQAVSKRSPDLLSRWEPNYVVAPSRVGEFNCVIVDMLDLGREWVDAAVDNGVRVTAFETTTRHPHVLTINEMLPDDSGGHLCGPGMATIGPDFLGYPTRDRDSLRRVLVCLGAADVTGSQAEIVDELAVAFPHLEIVVPSDTGQIAFELWSADLAVLGHGRMTLEAAYMGTPFVAVDQNERESGHIVLEGGNYVGWGAPQGGVVGIVRRLLEDPGVLAKQSKLLRSQVDGGGVARVCQVVDSMVLKTGR